MMAAADMIVVVAGLFDRLGDRFARYCNAAWIAQGLHLVVADIAKARDVLAGRGVAVSEVHDLRGIKYAGFSDPEATRGRCRKCQPIINEGFQAAENVTARTGRNCSA